MKYSLFIFTFTIILATCSTKTEIDRKKAPEHPAEITNVEIKTLVNEYFELSRRYNVTFNKNVTIGLKELKSGSIIGVCYYDRKWREIDLDSSYWKRATWTSKIALVYHELTHCYCERDHDFGEGKPYPSPFEIFFDDVVTNYTPLTPLKPEGYMDDGCPLTLMHPTIIDDGCTIKHYAHYVKEMFERCEPY